MQKELIIEIGAEGGSFSAYRIIDKNGNYSFLFGTNEMGLSFDEDGISTHSKNQINSIEELLQTIRKTYPEIYNLYPLFIHEDYVENILNDLKFSQKDFSFFDFRRWANILFLRKDEFSHDNSSNNELDKLVKILKTRLNFFEKTQEDEGNYFSTLEKDEEIVTDNPDSYLKTLTTKELDSFYAVIVRNNPNRKTPIMTAIENIVMERIENFNLSIEELSRDLGNLHNKFKVFSKKDFEVDDKKNIVKTLDGLDDFNYLKDFYELYKMQFDNIEINPISNKHARSKDLPFVGKQLFENGKLDFIFYFEGSLSNEDRLSITVLAHLLATDDEQIIEKFCGKDKWWTKSNFFNIKNKLKIKSHILNCSYVTDAVRMDDDELNRELIQKEIELFKPKLVICVGTKAKELVGMKYYPFSTKFHYVRFPKYHNNSDIYEELNNIIESL